MTHLTDLGLTPSQHAELDDIDPDLIDAWLTELDKAHAVKNPAGWFLTAVRTGNHPGTTTDNEQAKQARLAENYIRNTGLYLPTEAELLDDLFGDHGKLKRWATDQPLRNRMLTLWRQQQPRAQQAARDSTTRAEKWKAGQALLHEVKARAASTEELIALSIREGEPEPFPHAHEDV